MAGARRGWGLDRQTTKSAVTVKKVYCFRLAKSEIGLTHFEGRSYVGLMRHLS